ncbi:hypothetical protein H8F21_16265 [Pseudomonas sp. P66]|uniref:Uncharacterized protein n=1 Tax=Pseudomonas arcuscaelestis TaxID=2710591 RepID=A0ABS2BZR8_9PSED|nr:hypothetical protein [Pseudomonas arcuscaelestis]MBM3112849.1 hypothetical protein [Pseudomonas arcuscaelestis]MBM5459123.1 hypothetical protein [Pseudomonas arcuscaelestis]
MSVLNSGDNLLSFNAYLQVQPETIAKHAMELADFDAPHTFALSYEYSQ